MDDRVVTSRSLIVPPLSRRLLSILSFIRSLGVAALEPPPSDTVRPTELACDVTAGVDGVRAERDGITSGVGDGDSLDSSDVRLRLRRWRMRSPIVSSPEVVDVIGVAVDLDRIILPLSV